MGEVLATGRTGHHNGAKWKSPAARFSLLLLDAYRPPSAGICTASPPRSPSFHFTRYTGDRHIVGGGDTQ